MGSIFKILFNHVHKMKDIPGARENVEGAMTQLQRSQASLNVEMQ